MMNKWFVKLIRFSLLMTLSSLLVACGGEKESEYALDTINSDAPIGLIIELASNTMNVNSELDIATYLLYGNGKKEKVDSDFNVNAPNIASIKGNVIKSNSKTGYVVIQAFYNSPQGKVFYNQAGVVVTKPTVTGGDKFIDKDKVVGLEISPYPIVYVKENQEKEITAYKIMGDGTKIQTEEIKLVSQKPNFVSTNGYKIRSNSIGNNPFEYVELTARYTDDNGNIFSKNIGVFIQGSDYSPDNDDIVALNIIPEALTMNIGDSIEPKAFVLLGDGSEKEVKPKWSVSKDNIITLKQGKITALKTGTSKITATFINKDGNTFTDKLNVAVVNNNLISKPVITDIKVDPDTILLKKGESFPLEMIAIYSNGQQKIVQGSWSVDDQTILDISNNTVAGLNVGNTIIHAFYQTNDGRVFEHQTSALVFSLLNDKVKTIGIRTEPNILVMKKGQTKHLTAYKILSDGKEEQIQVNLISDNNKVLDANSSDVIAVNNGLANIQVSYNEDGKTFTKSLSGIVQPTVIQSIDVSQCATTLPKGATEICQVNANYDDGTILDISSVVFITSSDQTVVASNNFTKQLQANMQGEADILYSWNGATKSVRLTVTPPELSSITTKPQDISDLPIGFSRKLSVYATFSDSTVKDITDVANYNFDDSTIASKNNDEVFGDRAGATTLTVEYQNKTSSLNVEVIDKELKALVLTPSSLTIPVGYEDNVDVKAIFTDGSSMNADNVVHFTIGDQNILSISDTKVSALTQGATTINADYLGINSNTVFVSASSAKLTRIEVTPNNVVLPIGVSNSFKAEGEFDDGTSLDLSNNVVWMSSDQTNLESEGFGTFKALQLGNALVKAEDSGSKIVGSANVIMSSKHIVSLEPKTSLFYLPAGLSDKALFNAIWSDGSESVPTQGISFRELSDKPVNPNDARAVNVDIDGIIHSISPGIGEYKASYLGVESKIFQIIVSSPSILGIFPQLADLDGDGQPDDSVPVGINSNLRVTAKYSDGREIDITNNSELSCNSSNPSIAGLNLLKEINTFNDGRVVLTCSYEGYTSDLDFNITPAELTRISLMPNTTNLVIPHTLTVNVMGDYTDGSTKDITPYSTFVVNETPNNTAYIPVLSSDASTADNNEWYGNNIGRVNIQATVPDSVTHNGVMTADEDIDVSFQRMWFWHGKTYTYAYAANADAANNHNCPGGFTVWQNWASHYSQMIKSILPGDRFNFNSVASWRSTAGKAYSESAGDEIRVQQNGYNGYNVFNGHGRGLYYQTDTRAACWKNGRVTQ
ncbi:hypothetical protein ACWX0P_30990 [Vibrio mediterranei]